MDQDGQMDKLNTEESQYHPKDQSNMRVKHTNLDMQELRYYATHRPFIFS